MLESLRSKSHDLTTDTSSVSEKDKEAQEGRLKMLEVQLGGLHDVGVALIIALSAPVYSTTTYNR